jgi:hypothetical protein
MKRKIEMYLISILILLQRTELQEKYRSSAIARLNVLTGGILSLLRVLYQGLDSKRIMKLYEDHEQIIEQSSEICDLIKEMGFTKKDEIHVADIGAGIAGYHRKWLSEYPNGVVHLVDRSKFQLRGLIYGHKSANRYYNNLNLAKKYLLLSKQVKPDSILLVDSKSIDYSLGDCQIVISFLSLGFHYPLATYWDSIWANSKVHMLLLDIRTNSASEKYLFENVKDEFKVTLISSVKRSSRFKIERWI